MTDLAGERPEVLTELLAAWDDYVEENGVIVVEEDRAFGLRCRFADAFRPEAGPPAAYFRKSFAPNRRASATDQEGRPSGAADPGRSRTMNRPLPGCARG